MDKSFIDKLTAIIEENLSNSQFGVDELAIKISISRSSLLRKVNSITGKSTNQFIREIRLHRAMDFILEENLTAAEAAYRAGFSSPAYFNNCFHEYFGYPPGEARKKAGIGQVPIKGEAKMPDRKSRIERMIIIITSGIVIAFTVFVLDALLNNSNNGETDQLNSQEKTIAVLPFQNLSNDTSQQITCYGFKDNLITNLIKIKSFRVKSSSEPLWNTKKTLQTIGKELDVDYLITGSLGFEGNKLKILVQLIESKTGTFLWALDTIRAYKEILTFQSNLAETIAAELNTKLSPQEVKKIEKLPTENIEAYNSYSKGLYYTDFSHGVDMQLAEKWYRRAIELDPRFAEAYLGLANTLTWTYQGDEDRRRELLAESIRTIEKVIEIDPNMPEAYMALGRNYMADENYGKAQEQFEQCLVLRPTSPTATFYMGTTNMYLGNWDEALRYLKKHYEMLPKGVQINLHMGLTYEYLRDFPRAIQYYDQVIALNPVFTLSYNSLSDIALKWKGDTGKARKILEEEEHDNPPKDQTIMYLTYRYVWMDLYECRYEKIPGELSRCPLDVFPADYFYQPKYLLYAIAYGFMKKPDLERAYYDSTRVFLEKLQKSKPAYQTDARVISTLGLVQAGLGHPDQAIKLGEEAVKLVPVTKNALKWPYLAENLAYMYTRAGNYPEALRLLNDLLSTPGPLTAKLLEMDPRWAPLKNLPGFKKLIKDFPVN